MAILSEHPYAQYHFSVDLSTGGTARFTEVSGLDVRIDVIEYRDGADPGGIRKLNGLARYSNLVLARGVTGDLDLWQWIETAIAGRPERRDVSVSLLNEDHEPAVRWRVRRAWPARYVGPLLRAEGTNVAIEVLELAHDGFDLD